MLHLLYEFNCIKPQMCLTQCVQPRAFETVHLPLYARHYMSNYKPFVIYHYIILYGAATLDSIGQLWHFLNITYSLSVTILSWPRLLWTQNQSWKDFACGRNTSWIRCQSIIRTMHTHIHILKHSFTTRGNLSLPAHLPGYFKKESGGNPHGHGENIQKTLQRQ